MKSRWASVSLTIFLWMLCLSSAAAEGLARLNVDIPPGKWKAIRLRNLPKDAVLAVQVVSNGEVAVALVDSKNYQGYAATPRPLFLGRVEKQLSFSVSIPATDDYFVVLDNRLGQDPRAVTVTVRAARASAGQKKSAEEILTKFERQLHQIFVFDPFPVGTKKCGAPKAFVDTSGIVLCEEYVHHLYDTLKDPERTRDALSFSIFHEVSRMLLSQWNYPSFADERVADEFATVLMIMVNQKNRAIAIAEYLVKNPSASETLQKLFGDERHPLSGQRANNILRWARDPQFARQWQKVLVPHMQTSLLKRLRQQPTSWTDSSLVERELSMRSSRRRTGI
jgi:hypothetical protein